MAAPKKTKHDVVCEFRCTEILQAARKVFARKGFDGATVDEIAEAAGVAKGTVYLYFQSKSDIYFEALRRGLVALIEETSRKMEAAPSAAGKIRAFISTRIHSAEANRDLVSIYLTEFGKIHACVHKEFRNLYLRQSKALETILQHAAEQGQIRAPRPELAALMIYEMTRGLVVQRLLGWSKTTADEDIEALFGLIWRALAP